MVICRVFFKVVKFGWCTLFFWGAKYKYTLVTLNRCDCLRCFLSEITASVQLEKSFFKFQTAAKAFFSWHVLCLKGATRTKEPDLGSIGGGGGRWRFRENFLRFYKMACKSVFLLKIKSIDKFKLLWQSKIGGGGGKFILLCDERKHGGRGVLPKKILKKVERNQRPK